MKWPVLLHLKEIVSLIIFGIVFLNPLRKNKLYEINSLYLINLNWNKVGKKLFLFAISFMIMIIIFLSKMEVDNSRRKFSGIEDKFFLLNSTIFYFLNCLTELLSYLIIILSLTNFFRMFITAVFITINYFWNKKKLNQSFFSWKDKYVLFIFANYFILWCLFPYFSLLDKIRYVWKLLSMSFEDNFLESLNEIIKNIKATAFGSLIYSSIEIITASTSTASLVYFANMYYNEKVSFFQNFWNDVNLIGKRVEGFKFFFKTQLSLSNNYLINDKRKRELSIDCYENFNLIPSFMKDIYVGEEKTYSYDFFEKIKKIREFILQIENNVEIDKEKKFIFHSLFNKYESFEDLEKNRIKLNCILKNTNF